MAGNTFLVSVANAVGLDPNTNEAIFFGKANLSSALTLSMQSTDVRGGINNPLLYKYMHDRDLEINVEQAVFGKTFLALNVGSSVLNSTVNVLKTECVQLTAGAGVVTETPVGNVSVLKADGTMVSVTPSSKNITVVGGANTAVTVFYKYSDSVDRLTVQTTTPPSIITLILTAEVRDNKNNIVEYFQIEVPSFQIDGNYVLDMSADGVSKESLKGMALAVNATDCTSGDTYAYVSWIPTSATTVPYAFIAATPSNFNPAVGSLPATQQITAYGVRGGIYANVNITSGCTYAKAAGGDADISVNASTGLITVAGTAIADDTATIVVTYNDGTTTFTDDVIVKVVA